MIRAAIDVGSHSAQLLVRDPSGPVLVDHARVTALARGMGEHGPLQPEAIARLLTVLSDFADVLRAHGLSPADTPAQATSALRRASNRRDVLARVADHTGFRLAVIDGTEEAARNAAGALSDRAILPGDASSILVVDIGGGSTELVLDTPRGGWRHSLEIGSVRLVETCLPGDDHWTEAGEAAMARAVQAALSEVATPPRVDAVVAIAGTATTLATRLDGRTVHDPTVLHGRRLHVAELTALTDRWRGSTGAARRLDLPADPERAGPVPGGLTLLRAILSWCGQDAAIVSRRDARWWLTGAGTGLPSDGSRE